MPNDPEIFRVLRSAAEGLSRHGHSSALADFIAAHPGALDEEDPPLVYARLLKVKRLVGPSRERLQEATLRSQA
jgi:hypothetical protein